MPATLYIINIKAEDEIKLLIKNFMDDMHSTDVAIEFGKDNFDLAFLTKKPEYLTTLNILKQPQSRIFS